MRVARFLPQRLRNLGPELIKFGTIGMINLVINFAVFNVLVLTVFHDGQLKANVIAAIVATTASFFMNRHWTYRDRPKSAMRLEYTLFFLFNLVGLVIELGVIGFAKYGLHITDDLVAINAFKILGVLLGTLFRFWAYRTHVFKDGGPADGTPEDAPLSVTELVAHELEGHHHGEGHHGDAHHGAHPREQRAATRPPTQATGIDDDLDDELDDLVATSDHQAHTA